jgi:CTP:molybdopterin cytidylyltransferase MocA
VLKAQVSNVRFVEIDDAAILRDIDQPDDLLSTAERLTRLTARPAKL